MGNLDHDVKYVKRFLLQNRIRKCQLQCQYFGFGVDEGFFKGRPGALSPPYQVHGKYKETVKICIK